MTAQELEDELRSFAQDPRFCAVVGWLDATQRRFSEEGCRQALAKEHGVLAHCQGSVYGLGLALAQLRAAMAVREAGGGIPLPAEPAQ